MDVECSVCKKSKGVAVDTGLLRLTNPPKREYVWTCDNCDHKEFLFLTQHTKPHEIHTGHTVVVDYEDLRTLYEMALMGCDANGDEVLSKIEILLGLQKC